MALVPHDGLEHHDRARLEHEGRVERVAEVAADEGHLRAVEAHAVRQVEVGHPRRGDVSHGPRRGGEVRAGGAGTEHGERGVVDRAPLFVLRLLAR